MSCWLELRTNKFSHLNNKDKLNETTKNHKGWQDILREAEDIYKCMTTKGNNGWPPACNPNNDRSPCSTFGANLTQCSDRNGNHPCVLFITRSHLSTSRMRRAQAE